MLPSFSAGEDIDPTVHQWRRYKKQKLALLIHFEIFRGLYDRSLQRSTGATCCGLPTHVIFKPEIPDFTVGQSLWRKRTEVYAKSKG
ncbi:hypothetical protein MMC31_007152 [Peltigera leucophlebia]|nr:hypothetical protein [Peltigera leucophlebia]